MKQYDPNNFVIDHVFSALDKMYKKKEKKEKLKVKNNDYEESNINPLALVGGLKNITNTDQTNQTLFQRLANSGSSDVTLMDIIKEDESLKNSILGEDYVDDDDEEELIIEKEAVKDDCYNIVINI